MPNMSGGLLTSSQSVSGKKNEVFLLSEQIRDRSLATFSPREYCLLTRSHMCAQLLYRFCEGLMNESGGGGG